MQVSITEFLVIAEDGRQFYVRKSPTNNTWCVAWYGADARLNDVGTFESRYDALNNTADEIQAQTARLELPTTTAIFARVAQYLDEPLPEDVRLLLASLEHR